MGLADDLLVMGSSMRRLTSSLGRFQHAAGSISPTMAAASMVPGVFRRDTPADVVAFKFEQEQTGITQHVLGRDTAADRAALRSEVERTAQQLRPFSRDTEADRAAQRRATEIAEQQMRPFRR